jgi:hypothetical protein
MTPDYHLLLLLLDLTGQQLSGRDILASSNLQEYIHYLWLIM